MDEVTVRVEVRAEQFSDRMRDMQHLHDLIDRQIHAITGVRMQSNSSSRRLWSGWPERPNA